MSKSENKDGRKQGEFGFEEQKLKAEIDKLEWEAKEISNRIEVDLNRRKRRIWEILIGGLVAGTLFYAWFIGFYSPLIEIQKERLQFDKDQLAHELQAALRQSSNSRDMLLEQTEYVELIGKLTSDLQIRVEKIQSRIENQASLIQSNTQEELDIGKAGLLKYFRGELDEIDEIDSILSINIEDGKHLVERAYREIYRNISNQFFISVVYDSGFSDLADLLANALQQHGFNVDRVERWRDFREDGDGPMSRFFSSGIVIWYDEGHEPTNNVADVVKDALTGVVPENTTVRRGETVVVPGTTWSTPQEYHLQLWVF